MIDWPNLALATISASRHASPCLRARKGESCIARPRPLLPSVVPNWTIPTWVHLREARWSLNPVVVSVSCSEP